VGDHILVLNPYTRNLASDTWLALRVKACQCTDGKACPLLRGI